MGTSQSFHQCCLRRMLASLVPSTAHACFIIAVYSTCLFILLGLQMICFLGCNPKSELVAKMIHVPLFAFYIFKSWTQWLRRAHKLSSKSGEQKKPWAEMAPAWVHLEVSKGSLFSRLLQPKLDAVDCDSYTPPKRTTAASSVLLTPPPQRGTVIARAPWYPGPPPHLKVFYLHLQNPFPICDNQDSEKQNW